MGYRTEFTGELTPTNPLSERERAAIWKWHGWNETGEPTGEPTRTTADIAAGAPKDGLSPWRINRHGYLFCEDGTNTDYQQWLRFLIADAFTDNPLNGEVYWSGTEWGDSGAIEVSDDKIRIGRSVINYDDDAATLAKTQLYDRISAILTNWEENRESVTKFNFYDVLVDVQNYLAP